MRVEGWERGIIAGEADVVSQGVEPDVIDEILVEREFDPPVEP